MNWNLELESFQMEFMNSTARHPNMTAAWGTGKTMLGILKGCKLSELYPGNKGLILRKNMTDLRDCYDDQAEILTDSGWKFFNDLGYKDQVLSLDKSGVADYSTVTRIIRQSYKGPMKHYAGSVNFCVTPNHKVYISRPTSKNYKKSQTGWFLIPVEDIDQKVVYFKKDFKWIGEEIGEMIFEPPTSRCVKRQISGDDWCEFLGWFISEGDAYLHKTKKTWWTSIAQSEEKNPENYKEISELLRRMGIKATCVKDRIVFGSRSIGEHLLAHCGKGAPNKRIPDYLRWATPRQIQLFLDSYAKGDGYKFGNGVRYNTTSQQLAGDIQELIAKTGSYARVSIRDNRGNCSFIIDHWATTNHLDYLIIQQSCNHKTYDSTVVTDEIEDIEYNGEIFCVETEPHHTVYIRRAGTCYWSGNSTMSDFQEYTQLRVKVQSKTCQIPVKTSDGGGSYPPSDVIFHHVDELAGVIQNINLGWFLIEQGEELDTDEVFETLGGRLRRVLTPRREIQEQLVKLGALNKVVPDFRDLNYEEALIAESAIISKLGLPLRQGIVIANTKGHNWIWRKFKRKGKECITNKPFDVTSKDTKKVYSFGKFAELFEATTYDNADHLRADFLAACDMKKETAPSHYRRFIMNSWEDADIDNACIPYSKILEAVELDIREYGNDIVVLSADPAEHGNDKFVIYVLKGLKVIDELILSKKELMESVGHIVMKCGEYHPDVIAIDDIGVGAGPRSRLLELKNEKIIDAMIMPINYGKTAIDNEHFHRVRDEMIMFGSQLFKDGYVSIPNDQDLIEELAAFTYEPNSKGQVTVLRKKEIKEIIGRSTDKADTLFMGLWAAKKAPRRQVILSSVQEDEEGYDVLGFGL